MPADGGVLRLSESGFGEAARVTRNHRLWELYLIRHADIAPSHVDRDADMVEHVLGAALVQQLEAELLELDQRHEEIGARLDGTYEIPAANSDRDE